ncbi:kinase-like domain-containing protein [Trametes polyzona]|nr:kinase-like domain-containing protein [Trametes polyzona]
MSTPAKQRKLPNHAILDDVSVEAFAQMTHDGIYNLMPHEVFWQARYRFLQDHGYLLRPRYAPNWKPSWLGTNLDPTFCEDSVPSLNYQVLDATRLSNRELVAVKSTYKVGQELQIAKYFTSICDSANHCVPVYDIFSDPHDPRMALLVMPYLRPCNNPEFATVGDVVEFVDQTIEGLAFMHRHNVAHRDVAVANIMMEAKSLFPKGHHPVRLGYSPDLLEPVTPLPRAGRKVRYVYIDFGASSMFPQGSSTLVVGDVGRAKVPELSDTIPYDAFKVDIFALGDMFLTEFAQKYSNVDFLRTLVEPMLQRRPDLRPTIEQVAANWRSIRASFNDTSIRWRLVPKNEAPLERVVNDTVAVAWEGVYRLKKFVAP